MIVAFSYIPVVEKILISQIKDYFYNILQWKSLYPNFSKIRINNEFPWVPYMSEGVMPDLTNKKDLFPSVTIVSTNDGSSPIQVIETVDEILKKEEFEEFKALAEKEGYEIAPVALKSMEEHFLTKDELVGKTLKYKTKDNISIDITVDDNTSIKDRIYDYIRLYLTTHGYQELSNEYNIKIFADQVSGSRSGVYNMDFGRLLRGCNIQFPVDYIIQQTYYETDASVITEIEIKHNVMEGQDG